MLRGTAPITSDTALRLETVTRIPAHTWNSLQALYSEDVSRLERDSALESQLDFLFSMPLNGLRKVGVVTAKRRNVRALQEVCDFFEVANPSAWQHYWTAPSGPYSQSVVFQANPGAVAAWLRLGEITARTMDLAPVDRSGLKSVLPQLRGLTLEQDPRRILPEIASLGASVGVAVVFVADTFGARCIGATHWVNRRPIVALSRTHTSDADFWFALFHQLAHVVLHGHRDAFIEGDATRSSKIDEREIEADRFARDALIPRGRSGSLIELTTADAIASFAAEIGVSPGVVIARLQTDQTISPEMGNRFKKRCGS